MSDMNVARMESRPDAQQSGDAIGAPAVGERRHGGAGDPLPAAPMSPRSLDECGLDLLFLSDLAGKIIFQRGKISLTALTAHICLPALVVNPVIDFMRGERLVEIARRGANEGDVEYQLTEEGKRRAIESLRRCQYAGPAPVTLPAYTETVERNSVGMLEIHADNVHREYSDLVIAPRILDSFGAAMNSGRAIFVYGPAGSGKTYMAERLCRLLGGAIAVPHAVVIDGEIVQVFDPLVHKQIPPAERSERLIDRRRQPDARWVICQRPVVMTGGELTLSMLDLHFDQSTRFYQAPPHFKANNGIFIIDDLGRQLVSPRDLMNRWIVPLDRRCDYLALHTGYKFRVPFDVVVVFSTNVKPSDLADEAFLRRLGYKIFIGPLPEHDYREIFERCCTDYGVRFDAGAFDFLVKEMHVRANRPLLACYPRDLVGQIRDFAIYEGSERAMSETTLKRAWASYFVSDQ